MKQIKATIPKETIARLEWLEQKTGLSEETIITTALIIGTQELKKDIEEDE